VGNRQMQYEIFERLKYIVPMSKIYLTKNGNHFIKLGDNATATVYDFVDGSTIAEKEEWQIECMAKAMKKMHSNLNSYKPTNKNGLQYLDILDIITQLCDLKETVSETKYLNFLETLTFILCKNYDEIRKIENIYQRGIIHCDLHDENVMFSKKEKRITAVIDWDDIANYLQLFDLATTMSDFCIQPDRSIDFQKLELFYDVYLEEKPSELGNFEEEFLSIFQMIYMVIGHHSRIMFLPCFRKNEEAIMYMESIVEYLKSVTILNLDQ